MVIQASKISEKMEIVTGLCKRNTEKWRIYLQEITDIQRQGDKVSWVYCATVRCVQLSVIKERNQIHWILQNKVTITYQHWITAV